MIGLRAAPRSCAGLVGRCRSQLRKVPPGVSMVQGFDCRLVVFTLLHEHKPQGVGTCDYRYIVWKRLKLLQVKGFGM